jgi:pimeloyl-ACP methyl ester carboxylesterase
MERRSIAVDGIRTRWQEHGAGMPVIFVHGIPTGPSLWRHVVPRIAGARCLAFEMLGYAASIPEGRDRDISVARQADHLVAWAHAIGIERAVLVGHDLGGGVAQIAAVCQPGFCSGLLLTNAIGYDSWPIPSVKMLRACGPAVAALPGIVVKQIVATLMVRGHDVAARVRESLKMHWAHYARHGGGAALIRQINALDVSGHACRGRCAS